MKNAYLDNASTTPMRPEVVQEITKAMAETFGNPSSTHSFGRAAKVLLETARKTIAALIGAESREIIFTSGGTEGNNLVIRNAVKHLGVQRIISSRAEHHSVLSTVAKVGAEYGIEVDYVKLLPNGNIDYTHLVSLLTEEKRTLVSLMHVNNETGVVLDLERTGRICGQYNALFHTDTVQSMGKTGLSMKDLPVDFLVASAHKFHGPKGTGFVYARKSNIVKPMIFGGEQEKGIRPGTEPVPQITGMARALEISYQNIEKEKVYIQSLKGYLLNKIEQYFPGYRVNGEDTFYNIANIMLPMPEDKTAMILFHLDMKGVAVSRGSACQSGSIRPSHVLQEMLSDDELKKPSLRISLSHMNTTDDIDLLIEALKSV